MNKSKRLVFSLLAGCFIAIAVIALFITNGILLSAKSNVVNGGVVLTEVCGCPKTNLPLGQQLRWIVNITIVNTNSYDIKNIKTTDVFGKEFQPALGHPLTDHYVPSVNPSVGNVVFSYLPNGTNMTLSWTIASIPKNGGSATLFVFVYTNTNSMGQQEFISSGTYNLDLGANTQWTNDQNKEYSAITNPISVKTA
jgi:hypothetical protein